MQLTMEVLPAPFGPMMEKTSPFLISKETSVNARTPPKRSETCSTARIGVAPAMLPSPPAVLSWSGGYGALAVTATVPAEASAAMGCAPAGHHGLRGGLLRRSAHAADSSVLLSHHPLPPRGDFGAPLETKVR
jgi:hypothetical protein